MFIKIHKCIVALAVFLVFCPVFGRTQKQETPETLSNLQYAANLHNPVEARIDLKVVNNSPDSIFVLSNGSCIEYSLSDDKVLSINYPCENDNGALPLGFILPEQVEVLAGNEYLFQIPLTDEIFKNINIKDAGFIQISLSVLKRRITKNEIDSDFVKYKKIYKQVKKVLKAKISIRKDKFTLEDLKMKASFYVK